MGTKWLHKKEGYKIQEEATLRADKQQFSNGGWFGDKYEMKNVLCAIEQDIGLLLAQTIDKFHWRHVLLYS